MERLNRLGVLIPVILSVVTGCSHTGGAPFDDLFQAGRYREAVAEAERAGGITASEPVLYRVALAHLVPESEIHDPFRAEGLLNELLSRYPEGAHSLEARLLVRQLAATRVAGRDVRRALHAADSLAFELASVREARMALETRGEDRNREAAQLRARIRTLETDLQLRQGEVATLQRTLDELKRIDLRRSGGAVPPPPTQPRPNPR